MNNSLVNAVSVWWCPLCQQELYKASTPLYKEGFSYNSSQTSSLVCANRHQFDFAKEGYVNLLPVNQKRRKHPGDSGLMIKSRDEFLSAGFYQPLANGLRNKWLQSEMFHVEQLSPLVIADAGCGTGYYLNELAMSGLNACYLGFDVSKPAIKTAAKSSQTLQRAMAIPIDSEIHWAVASSKKIPIAEASIDVLLRVFAPGDAIEDLRVLKLNGEIWRVSPGPRHLYELRAMIYDEVRPHQPLEIPNGFHCRESESIQFKIHLTSTTDIERLLAMTPFNWSLTGERRKKLLSLVELKVQADFIIERLCREVVS